MRRHRFLYVEGRVRSVESLQQKGIWQTSQQQLQRVFDLLFPPQCASCKDSGHILCPQCLDAIQPLYLRFASIAAHICCITHHAAIAATERSI